jgi:hypothetical protein
LEQFWPKLETILKQLWRNLETNLNRSSIQLNSNLQRFKTTPKTFSHLPAILQLFSTPQIHLQFPADSAKNAPGKNRNEEWGKGKNWKRVHDVE